ncbi:ubiquitin carboxyl-terminal hydrolase 2-like [Aristolochia californica]|uniref:ubiquitin carboxyl-terminal hydrolase 2-like n=1 Tax=Aristolochia californica TaxID=171875 RepID=UPI0035DB8465
MGKKIKKKGRTAHKERRGSSGPNRSASEHSNPSADAAVTNGLVVNDRKSCSHISRSIDFDQVAWKIGNTLNCEDCRDNGGSCRRSGKGKFKQNKKRVIRSDDSNPKSMWVCLQCGHVACGGPAGDRVPKSHALQHTRRTRHPCVIQFDNSLLCWCFLCNSLAQVHSDGANEVTCGSLSKVQNLIKEQLDEFGPFDVEDDYVGSSLENKQLGNVDSSVLEMRGYKVQGLINLGNTCFFNSIMQNIFSMRVLRSYFSNLNSSIGPLTMALKKLFYETGTEVDSKSCLNPKNLFGCICSKAPQFRGYQQQDSHELLRYLLDGLYIEEINARKLASSDDEEVSSKMGPTSVDLVFGGQISSTICCMECGHTSIVYEPFLDLSLPLPTKKPPSKKAPVPRLKRAKLPLKEGNKGRKFQESKSNDAVASFSSEAESEAVRIPVEPPEFSRTLDAGETPHTDRIVTVADPHDFSWLDYCGDDISSENINSVFQSSDAVITQICDEGQTSKSVNTSESSVDVSSMNESQVKVESKFEKSTGLDVPTHIQDSEVLLLSYKEENDKGMGVTGSAEESKKNLVNCSEEIEDFDGFGDLFNETEATSHSTAGSKSFEEMEMALLAGNNSESNQDELDDINSEVTVDSCLAFFTKPELLSDEHAWYCEGCSKILKGQKKHTRDKIQQTGNENTHSIGLKSQNNMPANRDDNLPCKIDKDLSDSARPECLDNGNVVCSMEKFEGKDASSVTCELGEERNDRVLDFSKSLVNGLVDLHEASQSDDVVVVSNHFKEIHLTSLPVTESYNTYSRNLTDIESSTEVHQTWNEYPQLRDQGEESDGSAGGEVDSESIKVKRDASKKILICKAPHILTIHLKRFGQDARGRLCKISGHVSFRETLNLGPYMDPRFKEDDEKCWYRLVGVVEHLGTMRGGHYVAYVRGERNKRQSGNDVLSSVWFYASDTSVREVSLAEVLQSEAYILFYEKV